MRPGLQYRAIPSAGGRWLVTYQVPGTSCHAVHADCRSAAAAHALAAALNAAAAGPAPCPGTPARTEEIQA